MMKVASQTKMEVFYSGFNHFSTIGILIIILNENGISNENERFYTDFNHFSTIGKVIIILNENGILNENVSFLPNFNLFSQPLEC